MLNIFKKLLGKSEAPAASNQVPVPAAPRPVTETSAPMPQVEVAHLSLAAIMQKLPEDLRGTIARMPDESVTVALPLSTIQKQLPTGSVKMSLASLFRQAPAGTFVHARTEDRRMVEVPLSEIFRHVNPQLLQRREQRQVELPQDAVALFGDSSNPYAIAPSVSESSTPALVAAVATAAAPAAIAAPQAPRVIQPPQEMRAQVPSRSAERFVGSPPPSIPTAPRGPKATSRVAVAAPAARIPVPTENGSASPAKEEAPLLIPLAALAGAWPEPIRSEACALTETKVSLPTAAITSGLARGKVCFTWGQIRSWLVPIPSEPTQARETTELVLPLKVVAPAFLAHQKPKGPRKSVEIDETIPALFSGAPVPEPPPAEPALPENPVPEATPEPAATSSEEVQAPVAEVEHPIAAPTVIAPPVELKLESAAPSTPEPEPEPEPAPVAVAPLPAPVEQKASPKQTLGELLGNPEKTQWSPGELVKATVSLPGIAGATVALQEGLLVAADLPESMKGDTVAAFLPQIFARLTNYAGEMKLGAVEDVLFTTNGAHFQIFRLGEVYFAVLGKPGETLPWESLRLIAEELAHHHQK